MSIIGRLGSEGSAISHLDMRLKKNFDSLELEAGGQPSCHIKKGSLSFHALNSVEVVQQYNAIRAPLYNEKR